MTAKLLVVDDDSNFIETLTDMLDLYGINVVWADSIAKAMEIAQTEQPTVLLTDYQLPDGNGFMLAKQIGGNIKYKILMSGRSFSSAEIQEAQANGISYVLTKPFDIAQLGRQIKEIS